MVCHRLGLVTVNDHELPLEASRFNGELYERFETEFSACLRGTGNKSEVQTVSPGTVMELYPRVWSTQRLDTWRSVRTTWLGPCDCPLAVGLFAVRVFSDVADFGGLQVLGAFDSVGGVGEEVGVGEFQGGGEALHGLVVGFEGAVGEDVGDGDSFAD